MRRLLPAFALLLLGVSAHAQATPVQAACPVPATPEALIIAVNSQLDKAGPHDFDCIRSLFLPTATLSPVHSLPEGGFTAGEITLDQWIAAQQKPGAKPFYERQIHFTCQVYAHIAHIASAYEIRREPDGPVVLRGLNPFIAVNTGTQWKIVSIAWEPESPANPLPKDLLP